MKISGCFLHVVIKVFRWKKIKQSANKKSKRLNRRHPPIAQLVERRTVEKLISLGPWFMSGSADDITCLITVAGNCFTSQIWNKGKNVEDNFAYAIKCLPFVWLYDYKEQKKSNFSHWILKNINKNFCLFSSCRSQGFQMKKDQTIAGEQIRAAETQTTANSSVGRA